ncbi:MAG: sodium-translocating pyrophosphatase [Candidatus Bathyarchaeota archaeon]|nr:sodium-translocating pyrophosphatase [Candidatus Bathyarchaeota archaeon]
MDWLIIAPIAGLTSIAFAIYMFLYVNKQKSGTARMEEVAAAIKEGATAYLKRQNLTLTVFVVVMAVVLGVAFGYNNPTYGLSAALAYVFGSFCSTLAAYLGMHAAIRANVKTANAARTGLNRAFPVAFYGGAVMGFSIVGLALLGISVLYYTFRLLPIPGLDPGDPSMVLYFSFGASALALFAKAGGGIYTKTADISADLVGKVEIGIPEDDPRNPAVIADNVGDNVGDVAGMGADLIDSYIASVIASMIIAWGMKNVTLEVKQIYLILPLLIAAAGIFASVLGTLFVRVGKRGNPGAALNRGTFSTCFIFAVFTFLLTYYVGLGAQQGLGVFFATLAGLVAGVIIGITTDYFTSIDRPPVLKTAEASKTGAAINILTGFSYGIMSIVPPVLGICVAILASWYLADAYGVNPVYGVAVAAVGMLSIVGMIISADAYGPIADNAKGIAEQAGLGKEVIAVSDRLDAAGNTSKAITKGFAIGAAALTVLALFAAYAEIVEIAIIDITKPEVISGVFIGAMMPPLLSALLILAVGKNGFRMIEEIRRQFKEIPGLMEGKAKPDYAKCVDIAAKGALKELLLPCILAIIAPLATGFILGKEALGGFLAGSIITGIIFALFMANSGGAWDNAKKYIEAGSFGGEGSEAHKAAVIGDTVGDPFKDTAGPSLNTMITVMSLVASVFAPLIAMYALSW